MRRIPDTRCHPPFSAAGLLLLLLLVASCGGTVEGVEGGEGGQGGESGTGEGAVDGVATSVDASTEASVCTIKASSYDQSCNVDSDCVTAAGNFAVAFGDYCTSFCTCAVDTINRKSVQNFITDVSKTPLGSGAIMAPVCSCTFPAAPCCRNGMCTTDCLGPVESADAHDGIVDGGPNPTDVPDGSFLCAHDTGRVDAAAGDAGAIRYCSPIQQCLMFNGGWTCCAILGGVASCSI